MDYQYYVDVFETLLSQVRKEAKKYFNAQKTHKEKKEWQETHYI